MHIIKVAHNEAKVGKPDIKLSDIFKNLIFKNATVWRLTNRGHFFNLLSWFSSLKTRLFISTECTSNKKVIKYAIYCYEIKINRNC